MHCAYVFVVVAVATVTFTVADNRRKRLVLHSDMDIAAEVIKLRAEVAELKSKQWTTYVRWGSTSCKGNSTRLVYKGYMAGSEYTETGNGPNHLCLPDDPTWAKYDDGNQAGDRGYIYGTEFQETGNIIFGQHVYDQDVPCAVCEVPGVSLMIPARADCYPGWQLEYTGYLMSSYHGHNGASDYVCVDGDPDFITRGEASTNGHLLYLVEGICGTLVCPPYHSYRELACSVCSKI